MKSWLSLSVLLLGGLTASGQRGCYSAEYKQERISRDPGLAITVQNIENFTHHQLQGRGVIFDGPGGEPKPSVITIPVVVHIVYDSSRQNISDEQVRSQIDVLNRDFRKRNGDSAEIPGYFSTLAADCGFTFALATTDPDGNPSSGILRRHTESPIFSSISDDVKFTDRGGDDAWDRDRYLNIWVCNLPVIDDRFGVIGYSSIPGDAKERDGVVIHYKAFGTMGTAIAPFNLGRTATHEIGHWLNMIHVWGDADCGDDLVEDTPTQQNPSSGLPVGIALSCNNGPYGNMYMDYMDYTEDKGMHMFTYGQRDRMRTLFAEGGFRYPLLSSHAADPKPDTTGNPSTPSGPDSGAVLRIYPNPATGEAVSVVLSDEGWTNAQLVVCNQLGQKLVTMQVPSPRFQLKISSLSRGIYFVKIHNGQRDICFRLLRL